MTTIRDGWRTLRTAKGTAAAAVMALGITIGGATAVFTLADALLFRTLGIAEPERLVTLAADNAASSAWRQSVWIEIRDQGLLHESFAWFWNRMNVAGPGQKELIAGIAATTGLFATLRLQPAAGRLLTAADEQSGAEPVVVISWRLWQERFGGRPDALGARLSIEAVPHTIVGVAPPSFVGLNVGLPSDLIIPLNANPQGRPYVSIAARMPPGETTETMTARLRTAQPLIRERTNPYRISPYRENYLREPFAVRSAANGVSQLRARYERPLHVLLWTAGLMFLVGCGTAANLLLARTVQRTREIGIRRALGASRGRLLVQHLIEAALVAFGGAAAGMVIAKWLAGLVPPMMSNQAFQIWLDLSVDGSRVAFAAVAATLTTVVVAAVSAWHATSTDALDAMRKGPGGRHGYARDGHWMLALQVAASVTLLTLAGLFVRTFLVLDSRETGFDRHRVLIATIEDPDATTAATRRGLLEALESSLPALPAVESVGLSEAMPGGNNADAPWLELGDGTALPQGMDGVLAHRVSAGWFSTLSTRVMAGRAFTGSDRPGAPPVAIVNEAFAQRFLASVSPLGQVLYERPSGPDGPRQALQIVGVVEDAMYVSLKAEPPPTIYTPLLQVPFRSPAPVFASVRAVSHQVRDVSAAVTAAILRAGPRATVSFRTLADQVGAQYAQERAVAAISVFFGVAVSLLVAAGLCGMLAATVEARRFELAVRMAIGATHGRLLGSICKRAALAIVGGMAAGVGLALAAGSAVEQLLYEINPRDPLAFAGSLAWMAGIAGLGMSIPAVRALRADPATTLKQQ